VLTFAAGTPDEALYCTCDAAGTSSAFLAFSEARPAEALAATLTLTAGAGPCAVQAVPPLALLLLGRECGCSVEVVLPGAPWTPPQLAHNDLAAAKADSEPLAAARRAAALAVRSALVRPLSALLPAVRAAAGAPAGGEALPAAPSALRSALQGIMRARLESLLPSDPSNGGG